MLKVALFPGDKVSELGLCLSLACSGADFCWFCLLSKHSASDVLAGQF